jgi:hypothetical protein
MYEWESAEIKRVGFNVLSESCRGDDDLGEVVHDLSGVPAGKRAARDKGPSPPPLLEVPVEVDLVEVEVEVVLTLVVAVVAAALDDADALDDEDGAAIAIMELAELLDGALQDCRLTIRLVGFVEPSTATSTGFDLAAALCARRDHWLACKESAAAVVARRATKKM